MPLPLKTEVSQAVACLVAAGAARRPNERPRQPGSEREADAACCDSQRAAYSLIYFVPPAARPARLASSQAAGEAPPRPRWAGSKKLQSALWPILHHFLFAALMYSCC
jgi:hypothetical protein